MCTYLVFHSDSMIRRTKLIVDASSGFKVTLVAIEIDSNTEALDKF